MAQALESVAIGSLLESATNPRKHYDPNQLKDLVSSIKEKGVLVPLLVRPTETNGHKAPSFEIVAGSRRYRASKLAKLPDIPCIIRDMSDQEVLETQVIENDQREGVHPLEQAAAYKQMLDAGIPCEQIASKVGRQPGFVLTRLKLLDLIQPVQKIFLKGVINMQHAFVIAREQPEVQKEALSWINSRGPGSSVSLAEEINRRFHLSLKDAPFDTTDATLLPTAGACTTCPKRSGANKTLFPDIKADDICTDSAGYEAKCAALVKRAIEQHPDAVQLTAGGDQYSNTKPKAETDWRRADTMCPDTKEGVVIEVIRSYMHSDRMGKLGELLNVCMNKQCKTHWPKRETSGGFSRSPESKKAEKARKIELKRRALVFKEIASDSYTVDASRQRAVLDWAIQNLSNDTARALCHAMGWEVKTDRGFGDFGGTIKKNLAKIDANAIQQWIYQIMLADSELWYSSGYNHKAINLDATAKAQKVPMDLLAKRSKMNKRELDKLAAKEKPVASEKRKK